jgi:flagellar biosynthetic protein FlhB
MADFFEGSQEDRTESASSYRREEFRKQGSVAMSRDVLSVVLLLSVGLAFEFALSNMPRNFSVLAETFFKFDRVSPLTPGSAVDVMGFAARWWGTAVAPIFIMAVIAGVVACAAQVGWYVTWEPLTPDFNRINPMNGLQRIFSWNGASEGIKSLLKLAVASCVAWSFLRGQYQNAALFFQKSPQEGSYLMLQMVAKLFFSLVFAMAVIAVLDYAWQRYRLEQEMKVSKREAKDEYKLREGDPLIKSRIRAIQRRLASKRMMDAVPKADVVVTNPTHFAVALLYDVKTMSAPKVVAKGADFVALKIKELARSSGVPIVENKPLARTLYRDIEIGHFIPPEMYKAVAQVLGYVYRLKGRNLGNAAAAGR